MAPRSRGSEASTATSSSSSSSSSKQEGTVSIKGFVGGIASGLTKLAVGHPFDTVKVRLQCSPVGTYASPLDCVAQIARRESLLSLYKGATPPAVGWAAADSVLMGMLHVNRITLSRWYGYGEGTGRKLPVHLHAVAGLGAGWVNSFVMTPIELIKARLQMQLQRTSMPMGRNHSGSAAPVKREFAGPIDCARQTIKHRGILGLWHSLPATLIFRSNFAVMFGGYAFFTEQFQKLQGTSYELSEGVTTFLSGGLAAEVFWLAALPADTVKNRMMADSLHQPRYPTIRHAFLSVWNEAGADAPLYRRIRSFYKGCSVAMLRAFPTNAAALFAFETAMHFMGAEKTTTASAPTTSK